MLVQMFKCAQYAKASNRILYIDTEKGGFLDSFANYFTSISPTILLGKLDFLTPPFDVFPSCLSDNITTYQAGYDGKKNLFCHTLTNTPITFDFSKLYTEQVLVHEQCGRGVGWKMLEAFKLKENIRQHIATIINSLGEYDAVHIRNTDYKTDYKRFFAEIRDQLGTKVVVCTDDFECQTYAKSFFGGKLYIVTDIPNTQGKTLHMNAALDRFQTNLNTLCDLFVLACSNNLYFTHIEPYKYSGITREQKYVSGFSRLANDLHKNPALTQRLLYDQHDQPPHHPR